MHWLTISRCGQVCPRTPIMSASSELDTYYPNILAEKTISLPDALSQINTAVGKKFIIIIDEWDVLIRDESANAKVQKDYINFLRGMFKGTEPTKYIQLAYLTGILPIRKEKTQSALNNFDEFTIWDITRIPKRHPFPTRKSGRN